MTAGDSPLARAVRTKSWSRTSASPDRVSFITAPSVGRARATDGRLSAAGPLSRHPDKGSHPSDSAKTTTSRGAVTKVGTELSKGERTRPHAGPHRVKGK